MKQQSNFTEKNEMNPIIIIPARLNSQRFPNKMLQLINGVPLILKTARNAALAYGKKNVIIATCDEKIKQTVEEEFKVCITNLKHQTGTDRVYEAVKTLNVDKKTRIINVQGDQPFLFPHDITKLHDPKNKEVTTGFCKIDKRNAEESNCVKIVFNNQRILKYASRSLIPSKGKIFYKHVGVFGFFMTHLESFAKIKRSQLELEEDVEILRFLETNIPIKCHEMNDTVSIDAPEDLRKI